MIGISSQDDTMTQEAMKAAGSSAFTIKDFVNTLPLVIAEITGDFGERKDDASI